MSTSRSAVAADPTFRPPRFDRPIEIEEHVALLPPGASCKGLFFNDPIERLRKVDPRHSMLGAGEIAGRRHVAFFDYPYSDFMRVLATTARAVYPSVPLGEGLRRLGRAGDEALLNSVVVRPEQRGRRHRRGAGLRGRGRAPARRARVVSLNVTDENARAIALYRRLGFATYDEMLTYRRAP